MPNPLLIAIVGTVFIAVLGGAVQPAQAFRIKNRDDRAHQIAISTYGEDNPHIVEIASGEVFYSYTPHAKLRLLTGAYPTSQRARYLDEYVIWPGGEMHMQKRREPARRLR